MKKIILTITGVVFVAIAAQAQSPRVEVSIARGGFNGTTVKSTTQQQGLKQRISDAITRGQIKAQQAADAKAVKPATRKVAQQKPVQKTAFTQTPKTEGSVGQWLKAIFLGGKFPGESAESYYHRLVVQSHPSSMPFK